MFEKTKIDEKEAGDGPFKKTISQKYIEAKTKRKKLGMKEIEKKTRIEKI